MKFPSLDNPPLTSPSHPPTFQMPLLLLLPPSSKTSMRSHATRPCPSWVPVSKLTNLLSHHSPLHRPRGMCMPSESRTSAHHPLTALASQDLCMGGNSGEEYRAVYLEPRVLAKVCLSVGAINKYECIETWSSQANPGMAVLWIWASWAPSPCPLPAPTVTPSEDCYLTLSALNAKHFNSSWTASLP